MKTMGLIATVLLVMAVLAGVFLATDYGSLLWYQFIGPKKEAARRDVFKQTRSYNEGKEQELTKYRYEYLRAKSAADRNAIASTIRISFADYPEDMLDSADLRMFLRQIKAGVLPTTRPAWKENN